MKITAIIKASCKSNYFPERYAVAIAGLPLLEFLVKRLKESSSISDIVLATTQDEIDNPLVEEAEKLDLKVFRGNYNDPIGRLYGAALLAKSDVIVKIFGHYPLIDPVETDHLIREFLSAGVAYAYNEHHHGVILGTGSEVISFKALEQIHLNTKEPHQRRLGSNLFRDLLDDKMKLKVESDLCRPDYRVTLAVPQDVMPIMQIIDSGEAFTHRQIVNFLDRNPVTVEYLKQNISGTNEVGLEKIFLYPEKAHSIMSSSEDVPDLSYPVSIELSLTNRCNLNCSWCSDRGLRDKSMDDIGYDVLMRLLDDLVEHNAKGIVIEGGGEPTLYKDFMKVLDAVVSRGLKAGLITNGIEIPYLGDLKSFDWVRISLDAANREQFRNNKGRDLFDRAMQNIEKLANSDKKGTTVIGIGYVLTRNNEENLEELVLNLRRMHVDYIQIRPVVDHPDMMPVNPHLEYLGKYTTPQFFVNTSNFKGNMIQGNMGLPCKAHSLSTVITADGNVYICGRLNKYDWLEPMGNLYENSFNEIWNGNKRKEQSKKIYDNSFCLEWCPECRLTKYNILLDNTLKIKTGNFI